MIFSLEADLGIDSEERGSCDAETSQRLKVKSGHSQECSRLPTDLEMSVFLQVLEGHGSADT